MRRALSLSSVFFNCWYVRKVCSALSMSKYWYDTPLCFRLGFVNSVALLNSLWSQSRTVCHHMQNTRILQANWVDWKAKQSLAGCSKNTVFPSYSWPIEDELERENESECIWWSWWASCLLLCFGSFFKIICALGQGLAGSSLNTISKLTLFIWSYIFIYLVNAWLVTMSITKICFVIIYICVLLWP